MKRFALALTVLTLTGCATTAPALHTRGADGQSYAITGDYNGLTGDLVLYVNGEKIAGKVSAWDGAGTVTGTYQGQPVIASCAQVYRGMTQREECSVTIAGQPAGTLAF